MRILVTGASGTLGASLVESATGRGEVVGTSRRPPVRSHAGWVGLDVRDRGAVDGVLERVGPDLVISCAAAVEDWDTTARGPVHVAAAAARVGARLVHISSDAVFGGREAPYREDDRPSPVTPYGAAKAAAELAVPLVHPGAAIVRTSLIISSDGRTERERVVRDAATDDRAEHVFFTDDVRCPVLLDDLVAAVWEIASTDPGGIHHVAGRDAVSRHELATLIARRDRLDSNRLRPASRGHRPGAAVIRLDCSATQDVLSTRLRGAREFLSAT